VEDGVGENANPFTSSIHSDRFGSRSFNCPNPKCRRENYRPIRDELLPKCLHCGTDVSCKPPEPAPAKHQNSESPTWEKMLGVRPVELKTKVGERALVGAGK
jgi:hypothetical protein